MLEYFTDAVLRGPTLGSMLMCLAAALMGVIILLRKQSLIGESLSHAAYPGVIFGVISAGIFGFDDSQETFLTLLIMIGAFLTALLGLWCIYLLENKLNIKTDSALCFILSVFFGVGLTFASKIQMTHTALYRQVQSYLYGQAATMTDLHILLYGTLSLLVGVILFLFYKELQVITFNREYAKSLGVPVETINGLIFVLSALSVVIGIRSVGVVLMSAMFISPAVAARQFTHKLSVMLLLAAAIGVFSGFLGNYLSVKGSYLLMEQYPTARISLPTGPMIVMVASLIAVLSLLLAPERGLLIRWTRALKFQYQCICENVLKSIWRTSPDHPVSFEQIARYQMLSNFRLKFILRTLMHQGWIVAAKDNAFVLTPDGKKRAAHIVRLHRLWEVYLVNYLGVGAERVHYNAEEIEHIITPEIEKELTVLLHDPKMDPHHQKIPPQEGQL